MNTAEIARLTSEALLLTLLLSLPPILAATLVGVIVSLLQAITQVQEQTLSFAVKLIGVALVIFLTASWLAGELFNYAQRILGSVPLL